MKTTWAKSRNRAQHRTYVVVSAARLSTAREGTAWDLIPAANQSYYRVFVVVCGGKAPVGAAESECDLAEEGREAVALIVW